MKGEGPYYRERQKGQVHCNECREEMAVGSMAGHIRTQHGRAVEGRKSWADTPPDEETRTYLMTLPTATGPQNYPVEGCLGRAATRTAMRVHFLHQHVQDNVVILEEGNLPCPGCP